MKKYIITVSIAIGMIAFLYSCTNTTHEKCECECHEKMISADTNAKTSCPFLTTDNKENIVLSWVKEINDTDAVVCYAVSTDKGKTFGQSIEILSSKGVEPHGENLPKIIFKLDEEIIAAWGADNSNPKNKYSGLVYYAQSFDNGKNWSNAIPLVRDTTSYDQRYYDFDVLPNGEAGIIWLDNRKKTAKEGSTLYYAETNGKNGFQNEKPIGETCCQCCRTDFFVDSKGNIHAAYRKIINDSIRDMVHIVSIDGGKTFSQPERISMDNWAIHGCPHTGPTMAENKNGLHFSWYTLGGGNGVFYCNSKDFGKTFSMRDSVSGKPSAKHPQITTLPNGDIIIVWDETVKKGEKFNQRVGLQHRTAEGKVISTKYITSDDVVADFPVIKAVNDDTVLVAWVQQSVETKTKSANKQPQHSKGGQVFYKMVNVE